ncbi:MAG: sterol desaturase family protein [Acidobacteria bacterium]|nr:sterol desaturase family protein [Acidobacteriota bacterium]
MKGELISLAIPFFFVLILVEWAASALLKRKVYRLNDSLNDLSCGILQQLLELFIKGALFGGYVLIWEFARVQTIEASSWWVWVLCFLLVDLIYYWFHRLSHEVNFLWAAHVVHHQSEEYNLTVALRQSAFQGLFSWFFYIPLAILGFHPLVFVTCSAINTLYQFWIHTRLVGKMGPFEWLFNTPSHHRVHHGRNPQYIDRNHAGTLIIWDKIFGTFEPEGEPVVYGITKPLASWNPLQANVQTWQELAQQAAEYPKLWDKIRVFLKPPGWRPKAFGGKQYAPPIRPVEVQKFGTALKKPYQIYLFAQLVLLLGHTSLFLFSSPHLDGKAQTLHALWVVFSLLNLGWIAEGRRWAMRLEGVRFIAVLGLYFYAPFTLIPLVWGQIGAGLWALGSCTFLLWQRSSTQKPSPLLQEVV